MGAANPSLQFIQHVPFLAGRASFTRNGLIIPPVIGHRLDRGARTLLDFLQTKRRELDELLIDAMNALSHQEPEYALPERPHHAKINDVLNPPASQISIAQDHVEPLALLELP